MGTGSIGDRKRADMLLPAHSLSSLMRLGVSAEAPRGILGEIRSDKISTMLRFISLTGKRSRISIFNVFFSSGCASERFFWGCCVYPRRLCCQIQGKKEGCT